MTTNRGIRSYKPGDECIIVEIYNTAFSSSQPYFPRTEDSWLWRYVSRPRFDSESILIAEEDGRAVSSLVMTYAYLMISGIPRDIALIDDVATLPKYQGRGHATALVEQAIEIANDRKCYAVHLTADINGSAIRIYENLGFSTIANLNFMESPLHIHGLTRAIGFRYYVPMLFLNSWMKLKECRSCNIDINIDIVSGPDLQEALLDNQESNPIQNGSIVMDEEYVVWMTKPRPDGMMIGLTVTVEDELVGIASISAHTMKTKSDTFQVGNIANLIGSNKFWTQDVLCELFKTARLVAKTTLGCALASVVVDNKNNVLNNACTRSRFSQLAQGAAMIHPLANPDSILEIKKAVWAQPLETVVADP